MGVHSGCTGSAAPGARASLERFTGILIEHHAGHLPLWLAPVQVVVATVTGAADGWAVEVAQTLKAAGLRVEADLRNEKIGYKVREHALTKTPVQIALGGHEAEERTVTIRRHGAPDTRTLSLEDAVQMLLTEPKSARCNITGASFSSEGAT
ncbi:His/Gly/Thr/Pro-type tRNA ligase C-terminal domain-containing protein [Rhodovulum sulfidophilum]|uniref:His/Gly/Thr/Pro-type tRNA ligase C-terminal domain-containing protein n=1 Tax=Rhodovulum sulfidophilum TaxID=35806 RepID=UPI00398C43A7